MTPVTQDPKLPQDENTFRIRLYDYLRQITRSINQAANGQLALFVSKTAAYSSGDNDHVILIAPSAPCTITLPDVKNMIYKTVTVKRSNSTVHTVTIATVAGALDGSATMTLTAAYQYRKFYSDGVTYWEVT